MNAAQPMDSKTPPRYALHWARSSIRSTATFLYILAIILYIADGVHCQNLAKQYALEYDAGDIDPSLCWTDAAQGDLRNMLVAIVALIWNAAELITLCVNKRGIHPGANLGMDIVLWLDSMLNAIFSFLLIDYNFSSNGIYLAATSVLLLASILQFVLFILDAIAVHKWRRSRYPYPMAYMNPPQGAMPQGYVMPQAQPGFVYVQVPANSVTQQGMMQTPMAVYDPRQSMMPNMASPMHPQVIGSEISKSPEIEAVPQSEIAHMATTHGTAM